MLLIKNLLANAGDIRDSGLIHGSEDSLEEGMVSHSSILGWRIPWTEEPAGLQSQKLQKRWTQLKQQHTYEHAIPLKWIRKNNPLYPYC